jgi:hypothetical protein
MILSTFNNDWSFGFNDWSRRICPHLRGLYPCNSIAIAHVVIDNLLDLRLDGIQVGLSTFVH